MSEYFEREYNYEVWRHSAGEFAHFKTITHAGDPTPDFTLPALGGLTGNPLPPARAAGAD